MDNKKDDFYHVHKIITDLEFLILHTQSLSREEFEKNEVLLDSIMFRFIQISEHIKKLTQAFIEKNDHIPWKDMIGLRNRIVHEYGNIDFSIIYQTVQHDIYVILEEFKRIHGVSHHHR